MSFKICFNSEIHKVTKAPADFKTLLSTVKSIFGEALPQNFLLQYQDSDGDKIVLAKEEDYKSLLTAGGSIKVFVEASQGAYAISNKSLDQVVPTLTESTVYVSESNVNKVKVEEGVKVENPGTGSKIVYSSQLGGTYDQFKQSVFGKSYRQNHDIGITDTITDVVYSNIPEIAMLVKDFIIESNKMGLRVSTSVKHEGVHCNDCGMKAIIGNRYKCSVCADFNLCENCEENTSHEHSFLKMKNPVGQYKESVISKKEEPVLPKFSVEFVKEVSTIPSKASLKDIVIYKTIVIRNNGIQEWPKNSFLISTCEIKGLKTRLYNLAPGKEMTAILTIENPGKGGKHNATWAIMHHDEQGKEILSNSFTLGFEVQQPEVIPSEETPGNDVPLPNPELKKAISTKKDPEPTKTDSKKAYSTEVITKAKQLKEVFPEMDLNKLLDIVAIEPNLPVEDFVENILTN